MEKDVTSRDTPSKFSRSICLACATFLYVGYLPLIPGTFASAAVLGWFLYVQPGFGAVAGLAVSAIACGFACAGKAEKILKAKDARSIVIDEIAGMCVSLLFVPHTRSAAVAAFLVFRVMDTVKPYPVSRLQDLHGAAGIMLDDIAAAGYTILVLQAAQAILPTVFF